MEIHLTSRSRRMGALGLIAVGLWLAMLLVPGVADAAACPSGWTLTSGRCVKSFTASGSWTVPSGVSSINYLVVGGGGGGAANGAGSRGGAGGTVQQGTNVTITGGASVTVTVGAGGGQSANGSSSSISGGGVSVTASGGTGGGGPAGNGVNGTSSSITGSARIYGSSGGAGPLKPGGTNAGSGGGDSGGNCGGGTNATANYGGGGGGGDYCDVSGGFGVFAPTVAGSGGSGIVVISYALGPPVVSSFTTTASSPTNSVSALIYTLTFDQDVDATTFTAADLSNGGSSVGCTFSISPTTGAATTFTITVSNCGEGSVTPTLAASGVTSSGGLTGPSAAAAGSTVTIDRTAPSTPSAPDLAASSDSGSSSTDDLTSDSTPTMSAAGGDAGDTMTITASKSGSSPVSCSYVLPATSCTLGALSDGVWTTSAKLTDAAGNQSSTSTTGSLTIDTTAPSAPGAPDLAASSDSGSSSTDDVTSDTTPTVSATGGVAGDTMTVTATKSGSSPVSCSYVLPATSCDLPVLSDGTWSTSATLTDAAGNTSAAGPSTPITVDSTAPSPPPGIPDLAASSDSGSSNTDDVTSDATPTMSASGGSNGDRMTISATNGTTTVDCTFVLPATSCTLPAMTDGVWTTSATLTDPAGNSTSGASGSITIDGTAPSAPSAPDLVASSDTGSSNSDDITSDSTPTVSAAGGASGDTVTITASRNGTTTSCSYVVPATSCTLPSITDGTWDVTATITDPAGNVSPSSAPTPLTIDTTAPSAPSAPDMASSSDSGSSNTDDVTSDTTPTMSASGGTTGDRVTIAATDGTTTVSCSYVLPATSCDLATLTDGTWDVTATITDPAGNVSPAGPSLPITIDTALPQPAPGTPDLSASSDSGSSDSDDVTSDSTPSVSAIGGSTGDRVTLTATKPGSTPVSCSYVRPATSCDLATLGDGVWSVTATVTSPAGATTPPGPAMELRIDSRSSNLGRPSLDEVSDLGVSSSDGVTSDVQPGVTAPGAQPGDTVTITATKGGVSYHCTYDVDIADHCDLPTLDDGVWTLVSTAIDRAGNPSGPSAPRSITIDTSPPAAPSAPRSVAPQIERITVPGVPSGSTVTITGRSGSRVVTCTYVVGAENDCVLDGIGSGTWEITAEIIDAAGNRSSASDSLTIELVDGTDAGAGGAAIADGLAANGELPLTGSTQTDLLLWAVALLGVGGLLMVLVRRRGGASNTMG